MIELNPVIFPIKSDPLPMTVGDLYNNYQGSFAPEEFQRPESWTSKERKAYFLSVLMNRIEGAFVLVDVMTVLSRVEKIDPSSISATYFRSLSKDMIETIVLEGNNRLKFFEALLNDEYTIPNGVYEYLPDPHSTSLSQFVVGKHNNVFSKLPKLVQKAIKNRKVIISEYIQIDYKGLSDVFVNVNSGVPLNAQELRNALHTPWAKFVRNTRRDIASLLMSIFGDKYKKRLVGDEWIVDTIDMNLHNYCKDEDTQDYQITGVTQSSKNKLYVSDFEEFNHSKCTEVFLKVQDYINQMIVDEELGEKSEEILTRKSSVTNLFWMLNNGIDSYDEAIEAMILHENAFKDKDRRNDADETFKWACGGTGAKNMEFRMEILPEIVTKVKSSVSVTIP